MSTSRARVSLRLPDDLSSKLDESMKRSGKTLTAEIIERLNISFAIEQKEGDTLATIRSLIVNLQRIENKIITSKEGISSLDTQLEAAFRQLDNIDLNNIKNLVLGLVSKK